MDIRHISVSRKSVWNTCQQQYKYKYHLKIDTGVIEPFYFTYGSIVHKIAELYVKGKGKTLLGKVAQDILDGKIAFDTDKNGNELFAPPLPKEFKRRFPKHLESIQYLTDQIGFDGEVESSVEVVLGEIESRLSWQSQARRPLLQRIERVGQALLSLKEVEYLGAAQSGSIFERRDRLIDSVLGPLEEEWCSGHGDGGPVVRVKRLRTAILPEMVEQELPEEERQRRWRQLADCYLAQQMSLYPIDYIGPSRPIERILETVERFEEDLTDVATMHGPMAVLVEVGEAIEVPTRRSRDGDEDPLMRELEQKLGGMLEGLASEIDQVRHEAKAKEGA